MPMVAIVIVIASASVWASASASAAPSPVPPEQLASQLSVNLLQMHEVTITTTIASVLFILPAGGFTKICDWREIDNDGTARIESPSQITESISSLLFFPILNIDIAHHVVSQVVTYIQRLNFSIFAELLKQIFVEILKMFLNFARINRISLSIDARSDHIRTLIHVGEQKSRTDARFCVKSGATIAMSACSDLEVERTIHSVFLCTENRG